MARARAWRRRPAGLGAVRVAGLGGRVGQLGERPRLGVGVGDGAGQGLGVIEASQPRPHGGQADWDGLVTDGYGVPVDGQLDQGLQVRHVLAAMSL